ncbi:MAG: S1 RNA-binding domain-containing protein, partial [Planctomycetota bacterium]|nr:S1 RNA-binding domain-containing protein [Planctomycetota bacterium]
MSRRRRGKLHPSGRRMLINVIDPEEIRVAIVGNKGLEEFYVERAGADFVHGNIYKGRVQNVEPGLQAAFVDIGADKNGFLHASDVTPLPGTKPGRRKASGRGAPALTEILQKGQEILVQIVRETLGNKGPSLTMYLSL